MTKGILFFGSVFFSITTLAAGHKHKAHEHGVAKVAIAIESKDSKTAVVQLDTPAESIYGFEYEAKSAADKAKVDAANKKLGDSLLQMIAFDSSLSCSAKVDKIEREDEEDDEHKVDHKKHDKHHADKHHADKHKEHHGEHSDISARFTVTCAKPLAGTTVKFDFAKQFSALRQVNVQALSGEKQLSTTVTEAGGSLDL